MSRTSLRLAVLALAVGLYPTRLPAAGETAPAVEVLLSYAASGAARVEIRIDLPEPLPAPQVLAFPRAVPLGYSEQGYDRFVAQVRAFAPTSGALEVERLAGPRWRVGQAGQSVGTLRYDVDLVRMDNEIKSAVDASRMRPGHASIRGHSVFGYLEGQENRPYRLTVNAPEAWSVFSTLAPAVPAAPAAVVAQARDFHALADSQMVLGRDLAVRQVNAKAPLYVVAYSEGRVDVDLLGQIGQQALNALIAYFGAAPFSHYTVVAEFLKPVSHLHEYGFGREHLDSMALSYDDQRSIHGDAGSANLRETLYDLAHHMAHAWIPASCAGEGYEPVSWELAPVLDTVWLSEGFAQYVAMVTVGGMMGTQTEALVDERFRAALADAPPAIRRMTTVELSRVASTRYRADDRTGRSTSARGGMMAAEMDALIREKSGRQKTLRDGLRRMVSWCGENRRGFRVSEVPGLIKGGSGVDVQAVFDRWMAAPGAD